ELALRSRPPRGAGRTSRRRAPESTATAEAACGFAGIVARLGRAASTVGRRVGPFAGQIPRPGAGVLPARSDAGRSRAGTRLELEYATASIRTRPRVAAGPIDGPRSGTLGRTLCRGVGSDGPGDGV